MIHLTRLDYSSVVLNSDLIEFIESTPDTVISLTTGRKVTVRETAEEVIETVRSWRHSLLADPHRTDAASMPEWSTASRPSRG